MVRNWKVLLFVTYRVQMLYKTVSESTLGLTDVQEATSGVTDTVGQVERMSDVKGLFCALNGDEIGDGALGAKEPEVMEEVEGVGGIPDIGGEFLDPGQGEENRVKVSRDEFSGTGAGRDNGQMSRGDTEWDKMLEVEGDGER
eukprot:g38931.t1